MNKRLTSTSILATNAWVLHLVIWLVFLQLIFDISGLYYSFRELFIEDTRNIDEAFVIIPFMIFLFYWNSEFLIPRLLTKKDWWKYLISILVSFLTIIGLHLLTFNKFVEFGYTFWTDIDDFETIILVLNFLVLFASISYSATKIAWSKSRHIKEVEEKQKEAEQKFLIAQFNPHFLFNSLNAIYALATEEKASLTTESILRLSEIMRLSISKGKQKYVLLSDEIDFVRHYIELHKLRLGEDFPIRFQVKGDPGKLTIIPLVFIPFVENAIKYGVSLRASKQISIEIQVSGDVIHFQTENEIVKPTQTHSHGSGIENAKARLELQYENDYSLNIAKMKNLFKVDLKIKSRH